MRRLLRAAGILALAVFTVSDPVDSAADPQQGQSRGPQGAPAPDGDIKVMHAQGNVYMLVGAGANITASVGENGVLLVDAGNAASSGKVLAAIRSLSTKPIQFILNTDFRESHTGGNDALAKAGRRVTDAQSNQAVVLAHENVLNRMSAPTGQVSPRPVSAWPTDTFFAPRKEVYFNGEAVQMFHRPATTDGNCIVFFRKSDVISAGDIFMTTSYPYIDVAAGGTINGVIEGLNDIMDLAVPANNVEDGTLIIPGAGRLADELDVAVYRDMVTIIRDRVRDAIKKGKTLAQVKADTRITLEYDARYGAKDGPWTTDMFLEAVYRNLAAK
jgi:glyoxylase-like metal-dependent hydrolase (beta-lactamase superfamily II)